MCEYAGGLTMDARCSLALHHVRVTHWPTGYRPENEPPFCLVQLLLQITQSTEPRCGVSWTRLSFAH